VAEVIGNDLAQALMLQRDTLNKKFRIAKQAYRSLDDGAFAAFLRSTLDPVAATVAAKHPDRLLEVVEILYDMALPLVAQGWLGSASRTPALEVGWRQLLIGLAPWLCQAPRKFAGSMLNALHQFHELGEAALGAWVKNMLRLAPHYTDLDEILTVGRLLAWRHGLVTQRRAALDAGFSLPAQITQTALELSAPLTNEHWQRMRTEPQTMPVDCLRTDIKTPAWIRWMDGFSGFGGNFRRPPLVKADATGVYATDGQRVWLIVADSYGAQLVPVRHVTPWTDDKRPTADVTAAGVITANKTKVNFSSFPSPRQAAWHGGLLVLTSNVTHRLGLIRWDDVQP